MALTTLTESLQEQGVPGQEAVASWMGRETDGNRMYQVECAAKIMIGKFAGTNRAVQAVQPGNVS